MKVQREKTVILSIKLDLINSWLFKIVANYLLKIFYCLSFIISV